MPRFEEFEDIFYAAPPRVLENREEAAEGQTLTRFEAVVSEADFLNRNRRVYPEQVLFSAFEAYAARIAENRDQPGLVDHPIGGVPLVRNIGVRWETFRYEGKQVIGRGYIVPTQLGRDLEAAMRAGVPMAFSTRGYGELEEFDAPDGRRARRMVNYELEAVDAVVDPSVLHARLLRIEHEENEEMSQEERNTLEARLRDLEEQLSATSGERERLSADAERLVGENQTLTQRVAELEAAAADAAAAAAEHTLTARLAELTEGHRFAPTIIAEARALGATVENVELVVGRLRALVEAAGAAANDVSPRGVMADEELDTEERGDARPLSQEQLADLWQSNLISRRRYDELMALLT